MRTRKSLTAISVAVLVYFAILGTAVAGPAPGGCVVLVVATATPPVSLIEVHDGGTGVAARVLKAPVLLIKEVAVLERKIQTRGPKALAGVGIKAVAHVLRFLERVQKIDDALFFPRRP